MDALNAQIDSKAGKDTAGADGFWPDRLVSVALDDSWSSLPAEADLINRWFGGEIAKLFGD